MDKGYRAIMGGVLRLSDGACIRYDEENPSADWLEYLEWVEQGGQLEVPPPLTFAPPPPEGGPAYDAARQEAIYKVRKRLDLSYEETVLLFGIE